MKKALICGVSGQDGAYLSQLLLSKDYEVFGTSRDVQISSFSNLKHLGIYDDIQYESMALVDFRSVLQVLANVQPDEIYNLAGQSSVGLSFGQPVETLESISVGTMNLLEAIRFLGLPVQLYNACSSECFGNAKGEGCDENSPFRPRSPYAVAKAASFWEVSNYREAYDLYACSGILFNHESIFRPERFVTQKIIKAACHIKEGKQNELKMGNIEIQRDWGWAPEYVDAMWRMLQQEVPEDYVIATGETNSLKDFVKEAFEYLDLDWTKHVVTDDALLRPADIMLGKANPCKAKEKLGWEAQYRMKDVVKMMIDGNLNG